MPWTIIAAREAMSDPGVIQGTVHSGTRRPFGVRRRGRVEQFALRVPSAPASTVLRLVRRDAPREPLVAYHVAWHLTGDEANLSTAMSNRSGAVTLPLSRAGLYTVRIRMTQEVDAELKVWVVPTVTADDQSDPEAGAKKS